MRIASISVTGLFGEYDFDLELCQPITFVHSPNGVGKSTVMRMVYAALRGDVAYLSGTPFERLDVGFDDEGVLIVENDEGEVRAMMQKSEVGVDLDASEMTGICDVLYIPPERLSVRRRDGHLAPTLEVFARELQELVRSAKSDGALEPHSRADVSEMADGDLEFWCKDLKAKLDFMRDAGFEPELPPGARFPPSRYDISKDRAGCEGLACAIDDYVRRNHTLAESIIIFQDVVNEIFLNKTVSVSEGGRLEVSMDNGMSLQLQRLSSGERQILIVFYALLFHAPQGAVVILDEPEISLHVSWQQRLGGYFRDICRVRDLQMIVATHSPQVIHDMWDSARELRPRDARAHNSRGRLQPDRHGAVALRRDVPGGRGRHGLAPLRQVPGQGRRQDSRRPLEGQRQARGARGREARRRWDGGHRGRGPGQDARAQGGATAVLHGREGHGDHGPEDLRAGLGAERVRGPGEAPLLRGERRPRGRRRGGGREPAGGADAGVPGERPGAELQGPGLPLVRRPGDALRRPGRYGLGRAGELARRPRRQEEAEEHAQG